MSKDKEVKHDREACVNQGICACEDVCMFVKKVAPVEAEQGEKPDFDALSKKYALELVDEHEGTPQYICYKNGLEYIWDNYVSALQAELSAVKSISKQFETQSSERGYQIQSMEKERDELKAKLEDSEKVRLAQVQDLTALKSQLNVMENERNIALARLI